VLTEHPVDKILFNGNRALGVAVNRNGVTLKFNARIEVLLSGGAIASPALLQRSGIGPQEHLKALDIPVLKDSAEVGQNLCEHRGIVMQWRVRDGVSENHQFKGGNLVGNVAKYYLQHKGPMAGAAYEIGAWVKTRPELERPDAQILMAPFSFDYGAPKLDVEAHGGMNMAVYNLRPESNGTVMIRSADASEMPQIVPNYVSEESDRRAMIDIVRYARRLVQQSPLADFVIEETRPGAQYQSDEELLEAHRQFGYCNYHANGTCRMGLDENSVVDSRLRVRGVEGLRVVDASVFPFMLSGNTMAPTLAIAWRAADLILEN
jgi:choline dehydrogenase-like flavoprotein